MNSAYPNALPAGTEIGDFRIVRVLGAGGFGTTYEARHRQSRARVALKEYLPFGYATRVPGSSAVHSAPGDHGEIFRYGRDRFVQEAQTLARFDHPSIVQVSDYFEANNTAYMALGYEEGGTLGDWLKDLGRTPTQTEVSRLAWSLTDALAHVHSLFLLHRDIKPDNIMLRHDLTPVLIDFGTAKAALVGQTHMMSGANPVAASMIVFSDGYSPPEQYAPQQNLQGPWTDVYALAATLYRAIAGIPPPPASVRVIEDNYQPLTEIRHGDGWSPDFLVAIDKALSVKREHRPQSTPEFRRTLGIAAAIQRISDTPTPTAMPLGASSPGEALPTSVPPIWEDAPSEAAPYVRPRRPGTVMVAVSACFLAIAAAYILRFQTPSRTAGPDVLEPEVAAPQSVPTVAQRAVLYEEEPGNPTGKRFVGKAVWHTTQVPPSAGQPAEVLVRADVEIPDRKLVMTWSLQRNSDQSLPASHTVEIVFRLPPDFPAGGVAQVPGILMKLSEATRGGPLAGLAVKVTNGYFLIGLSLFDDDRQRNIQMLRERTWFDIPLIYSNNRRAILVLEKGTPGDRVFAEAFAAWQDTRPSIQPKRRPAAVVGDRANNPWTRAMMVSPSALNFMSTSLYGTMDFNSLKTQLVKPASSVMTTFSDDPHLGMSFEHFRGKAGSLSRP